MKNKYQVFLNKDAMRKLKKKIDKFVDAGEITAVEGFFDFLKTDSSDCNDIKFSAVVDLPVPTKYGINRAMMTLGLSEYIASINELQTQIDVYDILDASYALVAMINNSKGTKVPHGDLQYQIGNATSYLKLYDEVIGDTYNKWKGKEAPKPLPKEIRVGDIVMNHQDLKTIYGFATNLPDTKFNKKQLKNIRKASIKLSKEINKVGKLKDFPHQEVILELAAVLGRVVTTDVKLRISRDEGYKVCQMLVEGICGKG